MKITIETVANGAIISDSVSEDVVVYETEDELGDNYDGRAAVLWRVVDLLGWYGSKHDNKRIRIKIEEKEPENA